MKLAEIYAGSKPAISFELFPPKSDAGMESLFLDLADLAACDPAFMTCTYGAGGSTREKTLEVLQRLKAEFPAIPVASHLTCVGATAAEIEAYLRAAVERGVDYIVALRGDPPKGETSFKATEGGFHYASELVAMIKTTFPTLGMLVAGYPETHPEATSPQADIDNLKRKVDAGADAVVTQLFYDNDDFFRWRDRCQQAGIDVPIVPGLLPVTNLAQVKRIASLCGARIPAALLGRLERHEGSKDGQEIVGIGHAVEQARGLIAAGVPGIHFYVLNRSHAAQFICRDLAL